MKKIILLLTLGFISNQLFPQVYSRQNLAVIQKAKTSKMFVVLEDEENTAYNNALKNAVEKYWTFINEFEYIKESDLIKYKDKEGYTFLGYFQGELENNEITELNVKCFALVNKVKEKRYYTDKKDMIARLFYNTNYNEEDLPALLIMYVQSLNNFLTEAVKAKNGLDIYLTLQKNVKAKTPIIKTKKLLVYKEYRHDKLTDEVLKELYPYDIEFVEMNVITKAVLEQTEDVLYYYFDETAAYYHNYIFSCKNSELYFYALMPMNPAYNVFCKKIAKLIAK